MSGEMHRIVPVADGCGGCLLQIYPRKSFLAPFSGLPNGAKAHGIFSAKLTSSDMCSGHRPAGIPLKGAFHLQPRNGDTDRSSQPRYMGVRQDRASDPLNTRDVTKTTRPACAKSHASRNASRRRVKFCRRRLPRDGGDRLAIWLIGRMPSTRNRLAGRVAAIGHGGKGRGHVLRYVENGLYE